jgi:metallo-beta-lactamase family protein
LELLNAGVDPIYFEGLQLSITSDDSKLINEDTKPKVILSASGMCEAGRIRHHLKHNLWKSNSTILFVGYQSEGTVGRKLIDGATSVKLFGEEIAVHANIESISGISGHADKDMMINWLYNLKTTPERVFVNHGNDTVCDSFAEHITNMLGFSATAPYSGDSFDLITKECIEKGTIIKIEKAHAARNRANDLYEKLIAAGKRLLKVIENNKNSSNKEIARLTDQINSLCDKYK